MAIGGIVLGVVLAALVVLVPLFLFLRGCEFLLSLLRLDRSSGFLLLLLRCVRRNPLRTSLLYLAAFVLVGIVTVVWSALYVLDNLVQFKSRDIKVVVSEKWQADSRMPFAYARPISEGGDLSRSGAVRPTDAMTWQFYLSTIDPEKKSADSLIFFIAIEPSKAATVMDRTFADVPQESRQQTGPKLAQAKDFLASLDRMEKDKRAVIVGRKLLEKMNKRVGDRFKVTGLNFKDIDLEVEVVGTFPEGRYNSTAIMHRDYLNDALDVFPRTHGGVRHPMADRSLSLVVLEVPTLEAYGQVTKQIESSGLFQNPAVKCETLAAYAVTALDSYRDITWGMRWILSPVILVTLGMVVANGIGISVRERIKEMAVLKVVGYSPSQIMALVLGEAVLIGALAGVASSLLAYETINRFLDNEGSVLPVYVPERALWWGPLVGALVSGVGSLIPAWTACKVKAATVFARVA